jgi:cell wall-associated NlpC family hydrolase
MIDYAKMFIGTPYIWGGNGPLSGFDCSGFVQYVLDSCGMDPKGDQTSQSLFDYFEKQEGSVNLIRPKPGALLFYGKTESIITHIAIGIDQYRIIESGGGGRSCRSAEDAKKLDACVRIKPFGHRSDLVKIIMPYYPDYMLDDRDYATRNMGRSVPFR